jgi:hypothetical protein
MKTLPAIKATDEVGTKASSLQFVGGTTARDDGQAQQRQFDQQQVSQLVPAGINLLNDKILI